MDILPWHFKTFQAFGLYHQNPKNHCLLKSLYKLFVASLTIHFAIFLFITLLLTSDQGIEAITAGLFLSFTYIAASFKLIHFVLSRERIDNLLDEFRRRICRANDDSELKIFQNYQSTAKRTFAVRMLTTLGCSFFFTTTALANLSSDNWELPFNAYQVFGISSSLPYFFAYGLQVITVTCSVIIDVTLDATAWAFIILVCCQLDLLAHRIKRNSRGMSIVDCARHHNLIFRMVGQVQSCFIGVIVPSFLSALVTLCSSIYQLAKTKNTIFVSVSFTAYIVCLVVQLYYFCWFGNELRLKNNTVTNALYHSEWMDLSSLEMKNYWFLMFMGRRELVISYHGLCSLNMQTFIWMLRTSYAAFNLLQQISK